LLISNPVDVGAVVRQRRIDLSISQTELAERIDTTRQWLSRFEQGKADVTLSRVLAILRQLDLTVDLQPRVRAGHTTRVTALSRVTAPVRLIESNSPILTARLTDAPPPSHVHAMQASQAAESNESNEMN